MEAIKITVTGTQAYPISTPALTAGTVGQPVEFIFDEVWEGLSKTAVFRAGGLTKDVVDIDTECTVPWEVMEKSGCCLHIGIYGTNADGTLVIPTVWAKLDPILPGADPGGDESAEPTLPVWEQISKAAVKTVNDEKPDKNGNITIPSHRPVYLIKLRLDENGRCIYDYAINHELSPAELYAHILEYSHANFDHMNPKSDLVFICEVQIPPSEGIYTYDYMYLPLTKIAYEEGYVAFSGYNNVTNEMMQIRLNPYIGNDGFTFSETTLVTTVNGIRANAHGNVEIDTFGVVQITFSPNDNGVYESSTRFDDLMEVNEQGYLHRVIAVIAYNNTVMLSHAIKIEIDSNNEAASVAFLFPGFCEVRIYPDDTVVVMEWSTAELGDISTALDSIIAMQEELIGGESA